MNPDVDHPRWSQAKERRIGAGVFAPRQPTLPFNGYARAGRRPCTAGWTCGRTSDAGSGRRPSRSFSPVHAPHLKPLVFLLCSLPLAWLLARAFGIAGAGLGPNPIDEIMDRLGEWGLRLLLATLFVSPLAVTLRKPWLMGLRRMLGLFAFTYLSLHFLNWLVLDQWFDLQAIAADIAKRPYITVGFTAFLMLVPLAVTSTAGWMRRLGRALAPAAPAGLSGGDPRLHAFLVAGEGRLARAAVYATVLLVLLAWRVRRARARRHPGES